MVELVQTEIAYVRAMQRQRLSPARAESQSLCSDVKTLVASAAFLQAETRKTREDADRAIESMPAEAQLKLILRMIHDLSPEHRVVVQLYLEEKGTKLLG